MEAYANVLHRVWVDSFRVITRAILRVPGKWRAVELCVRERELLRYVALGRVRVLVRQFVVFTGREPRANFAAARDARVVQTVNFLRAGVLVPTARVSLFADGESGVQ